jgi:hypothetical protein
MVSSTLMLGTIPPARIKHAKWPRDSYEYNPSHFNTRHIPVPLISSAIQCPLKTLEDLIIFPDGGFSIRRIGSSSTIHDSDQHHYSVYPII